MPPFHLTFHYAAALFFRSYFPQPDHVPSLLCCVFERSSQTGPISICVTNSFSNLSFRAPDYHNSCKLQFWILTLVLELDLRPHLDFVFLFFFQHFYYPNIVVLGVHILWHLQKFLQYIVVEFAPPPFSFPSPPTIPWIVSTGLIFPFSYLTA
jgi:hypothetical protein